MNRYGAQAMRHWKQVDPERYQAIPDKKAFFTALGAQAEQEIQTRADALAGPDKPEEKYLEIGTAEGRNRVRVPNPGRYTAVYLKVG